MSDMIDPNVRTIDPTKVIITFNGVLITGYAPGSFVTVVAPDDFYEKVRGADGTVERYSKNVYDSEVTITLIATSLANRALDALHQLDKASGAGKGPLTITDINGTIAAFYVSAWIRKTPDWEGSDSASTIEWVIDTGPGVIDFGLAVL